MASSATPAPVQQEEKSWGSLDALAELSGDDSWQNGFETQQASQPSWMSGMQDQKPATPPAWLNMLTQDETRGEAQSVDATSSLPEEHHQPSVETPTQSDTTPVSEDENNDDLWRNTLQASLEATTDEESFSFGPEWLKSLGAAELEHDVQEQPVSASHAQSETTPQVPESTQSVSHESDHAPETYALPETSDASLQESVSSEHSWLDALSTDAEHNQHSEQTTVNT